MSAYGTDLPLAGLATNGFDTLQVAYNALDQRNGVGNLNYTTPGLTAFLTLSGDDQKLGFPGGRTVDPSIGLNQLVTNRSGTNTPFDYGNQQGANAVLKTLEEPPERGILFLVSHSPGALLPTIRSRCRRLAFTAPPEDQAARRVAEAAGVDAEQALRLVRMAHGAPGQALHLHEAGALALDDAARAILATLPRVDYAALHSLTEGFRGGEGTERFRILVERLCDRIHDLSVHRAREGTLAGLEGWGEAWSALQSLPDQVEGLNLDKGDALWTALGELRRVA